MSDVLRFRRVGLHLAFDQPDARPAVRDDGAGGCNSWRHSDNQADGQTVGDQNLGYGCYKYAHQGITDGQRTQTHAHEYQHKRTQSRTIKHTTGTLASTGPAGSCETSRQLQPGLPGCMHPAATA
ncbi:MAG: hypothetical protein M1482_18195 [Chloroflexi bacterium]|nr:hypothetical protein [Chloroflexota bacterium]